jgi:MscS family membrane protein
MDSYGDFALKLFLYAFTVGTGYNDYMAIKEDILLKIAGIVRQHGGEIAIPTSTVHMPDDVGLRTASAETSVEPFFQGAEIQMVDR